ncbi:UNVERIFIED_CONTAM: hypothetical protein GTU68_043085 [Idotea baltica]|nr:hypothetical protein [Idotea baltica]
MGGTVVFVSVVGRKEAKPGQSFFPLTVNYQEKTYAAGKIPGGFFRREGRPSEGETLLARLIDRPIRPLFPEGYMNEVQVIITVVSLNPEILPDVPAMLGTSAALAASGIPFAGPIGAAQVGWKDGAYILNPTATELEESELDLIVAGTDQAVLMVESEAKELSEEIMLGAVTFGHDQMQSAISAIKEFASEVGNETWDWQAAEKDEALAKSVADVCEADLKDAFSTADKMDRQDKIAAAKSKLMEALVTDAEDSADEGDTIRVVSEITESNGSSSMASVCGTSLSLMDAGVPIKAPVAGIAMGLVKEGEKFAVLTDILGDEDHLGDMDFKVAGTKDGINALQMDIKIDGITKEIMEIALEQAQTARLHILDEMNKVIAESRDDISDFAPRYVTMKINPDKIREVIGKGGETIRGITEQTGAQVDIDDTGAIKISAVDGAAADAAKKIIEQITAEAEVGKIYDGKVAKIMEFGAFVTILPGKDGLVHISQISNERVEKVGDHLKEGDEVKVKLLEIDRQGRMRLSMKEVEADS